MEAEVEALEHLEAAEPEPPSASKPRPPGPDNCHQFVRRQLAKALPDLFAALLVIAKKGDVSTVKLLWQLAQLDRPAGTAGGHEEDSKFVRDTLAKYRNR